MRLVPLLVEMLWSHPANRGRRLRALGRAAAWQVSKRVGGRPWDLRVYGGMRLRCYPDSDYALQVLYFSEMPDYHGMKFTQRYLRRGDCILDVGANVGVFTLFAASLIGPEGEIDAFEPASSTLRRLRENIALSGLTNVRVHAAAASEQSGVVRFVSTEDVLNRIETAADAGTTVEEVQAVRLDEELVGRTYAMGKMDVEGAEPLALRGAERLLAEANPPVWLLEMNGHINKFGWSEGDLARWLGEQGYDLAVYDADAGELQFRSEAWRHRLGDNVIAVARSAREAVLERLRSR